MRKNALFSSIITTAIVMTFVIGTLSPVFAQYNQRSDTDDDTAIRGYVFVHVEIEAFYPIESPNVTFSYYDCAEYRAWKFDSDPDVYLADDMWVWFYGNSESQPEHWYTCDSYSTGIGCNGSTQVFGHAGAMTLEFLGGIPQYEWLQADACVTSHYP